MNTGGRHSLTPATTTTNSVSPSDSHGEQDMMCNPTILKVTRHSGVAGQVAYVADVQYPDEPVSRVTFVGSYYGGPVVMATDAGQVFVTEPGRFGAFCEKWVRNFFEGSESA